MSKIKLRNMSMHTYNELPQQGAKAPEFVLTKTDLTTVSLDDFAGQAVLINVYPSIDTNVCFESMKTFGQAVMNKQQAQILCVSMDLPFALQRAAASEPHQHVMLLSDFRNREFGDVYGLTIADGPLAGLLARAVIVLDKDHHVIYRELVEDISNPPDYAKALEAL